MPAWAENRSLSQNETKKATLKEDRMIKRKREKGKRQALADPGIIIPAISSRGAEVT